MLSFRLLLAGLIGVATVAAFTTSQTGSRLSTLNNPRGAKVSTELFSSVGGSEQQELFKAGFLANCELEAADLASKKIRSVKDLGWTKPAKRAGNMRPRHWAWGGAGEDAVQDKPNYDESSPMCVEKWLSLEDFYKLMRDDTAIADTVFVALAGGGAFVERSVAEDVIASWRSGGKFDDDAFLKSVKAGRAKFATGWAAFIGLTTLAAAGIIFPNNPFQLALVDFIEAILGNDAKIAARGGF